MKRIALLGSTGSIGRNVVDVVGQFPDTFTIQSLSAGSNIQLLAEQAIALQPRTLSIGRPELVQPLKDLLGDKYQGRILSGTEGNCALATDPEVDMVVSAVVGAVGLLPALDALQAGKHLALANKETLVMAGKLVMETARRHNVTVLPIDSEHSAIFQALESGKAEEVRSIILTASGGPFRAWKKEDLHAVRPEQALAHPNWSMGKKISIDSATLMNKGLEVIEAKWLFDLAPEDIEVVVHRQSIVHSLVEFCDGSIIAQLGVPDMRAPIAYALSYPDRIPLNIERLRLTECKHLDFEEPRWDDFPALGLAFEALRLGGVKPAVLNAANEVAVAAFLNRQISFPEIIAIVEKALQQSSQADEMSLAAILAADEEGRQIAEAAVAKSHFIA